MLECSSVVEQLHSTYKALSSIPSITKKKGEKRGREKGMERGGEGRRRGELWGQNMLSRRHSYQIELEKTH